MSNPVVMIRHVVHGTTGESLGRMCWVWCPGCDEAHAPIIPDEDGTVPQGRPVWRWNGERGEHFGVEPSYLCWTGPRAKPISRCHSFIRDGHWQFLGDCTHHLVGQTVRMVPLPSWLLHG